MKSYAEKSGRSISFERGLANPNMFIGNSVIAYSTSPNDIALDNPNENNGIYTKYLKDMILEAGISFESILKKVARAVKSETRNKQQPWVHSNSDQDIFLNGENNNEIQVIYRDKIVYRDQEKKATKIEVSKTDNKPEKIRTKKNSFEYVIAFSGFLLTWFVTSSVSLRIFDIRNKEMVLIMGLISAFIFLFLFFEKNRDCGIAFGGFFVTWFSAFFISDEILRIFDMQEGLIISLIPASIFLFLFLKKNREY